MMRGGGVGERVRRRVRVDHKLFFFYYCGLGYFIQEKMKKVWIRED